MSDVSSSSGDRGTGLFTDNTKFELQFSVVDTDIDAQQHANNVVYLRWVQDVSTAHWNAVATPEMQSSILWVVLRHEIDYLRPAFLNDGLKSITRVGEIRGAKFERHTEIWRVSDNQLLSRVRSVYCALDAITNKPRRVEAELRSCFVVESNKDRRR